MHHIKPSFIALIFFTIIGLEMSSSVFAITEWPVKAGDTLSWKYDATELIWWSNDTHETLKTRSIHYTQTYDILQVKHEGMTFNLTNTEVTGDVYSDDPFAGGVWQEYLSILKTQEGHAKKYVNYSSCNFTVKFPFVGIDEVLLFTSISKWNETQAVFDTYYASEKEWYEVNWIEENAFRYDNISVQVFGNSSSFGYKMTTTIQSDSRSYPLHYFSNVSKQAHYTGDGILKEFHFHYIQNTSVIESGEYSIYETTESFSDPYFDLQMISTYPFLVFVGISALMSLWIVYITKFVGRKTYKPPSIPLSANTSNLPS